VALGGVAGLKLRERGGLCVPSPVLFEVDFLFSGLVLLFWL
jgi:hypothetical protein